MININPRAPSSAEGAVYGTRALLLQYDGLTHLKTHCNGSAVSMAGKRDASESRVEIPLTAAPQLMRRCHPPDENLFRKMRLHQRGFSGTRRAKEDRAADCPDTSFEQLLFLQGITTICTVATQVQDAPFLSRNLAPKLGVCLTHGCEVTVISMGPDTRKQGKSRGASCAWVRLTLG